MRDIHNLQTLAVYFESYRYIDSQMEKIDMIRYMRERESDKWFVLLFGFGMD